MSTIALPPLRKQWHNLQPYTVGGVVDSGTTNSVGTSFNTVTLGAAGLAVGDVVSGSAEILNAVSGETTRFEITARDGASSILATAASAYANNTSFARQSASGLVIPSGTVTVRCNVRRSTGSGSISIRHVMLNRGATAATFEHPKRGATAPLAQVAFGMEGLQAAQPRVTGVSQITSFPSRLWQLQFSTPPIDVVDDEFREWELVMNQLSDISNVFRFVPPNYRGPSTGYLGPLPLVAGAGQLGTSLNVDGLDGSAAIAKAGDYCSFEVTTALGNTNVQLCKLASAATSDGSGAATFVLTKPIRQAPADNAVVQIYSPTAQYRFLAPRHQTSDDADEYAVFAVDAEERVFP